MFKFRYLTRRRYPSFPKRKEESANKQLLDEVFEISGIIKVEVTVIRDLDYSWISQNQNLIIALLYIVLQVNKITANNYNICVLLVLRLSKHFFP